MGSSSTLDTMMTAFILPLLLVSSVYCEINYKQYLSKYGYLNEESFSEKNITDSLRLFQRTFKLKETGRVDEETLNLMKTPRCGNHDIGYGGDYGWGRTDLSYY